ncbi:Adaptor Protein Complex 2 subunit, mu (AP2M) [Carpediemonas membranifera]|uniref:Adaptor Protein Complex 2 subunit, mu (AP2M) n=1 Tax=Carpediemonas membranifera TaxID=201153 RepID=A0A8J6B4K1_9EUKA|nr:Adaptor Protein Complex 2 subunit, mu (AP2M) [Carpediemonas membranifera]|eukprot:KAG9394189.1 Adaptor Protein Complex 2 subunit, mu (AP2M) [Carpediemonas membranifera]
MIQAVVIVEQRGNVIFTREYRDSLSRLSTQDVIDRSAGTFFKQLLMKKENIEKPIIHAGNKSYFVVKTGQIFIVAVTELNPNAALVLEFLHTLGQVMESYCGSTLTPDLVKSNCVVFQEVLDEVCDFGFPQTTDLEVLKSIITTKGLKKLDKKDQKEVTIQATGVVSHRQPGIKYAKNEVFIDIIEQVNLLLSAQGNVLRSDVSGTVHMKSFLSGMPECKFGLNDKLVIDNDKNSAYKKRQPAKNIELDGVTLHQCVKLAQFDVDRTISFIPPDGEFDLMKYTISDNVELPFRVVPLITEHGNSRVEVKIQVYSKYASNLDASNVILWIPCPSNTASTKLTCSAGKAKYEPEKEAIAWRIRLFPGGTSCTIEGMIELAQTTKAKTWSRPPLTMDFNVPMFTASGMQVRFLHLYEKSGYKPTRWVRYVSRAGTYQIRY